VLARVRRHPVISGTLAACTIAGTVLGYLYLPAEWGFLHRSVAGAVAGAGTGLLVTATKMLG
jgi:hypothetical protein